MKSAEYWIEKLNLQPHPEGGFYKENYRSTEVIPGEALPPRFGGARTYSTSIYFLLRSEDRSAFHRIQSDELWHYHAGASLSIYVLKEDHVAVHVLGADIERGESLHVVIPANCWFGARVNEDSSYVLAGCTVAPGFDFADFKLAKRHELTSLYPRHTDIIHQLTK